MLRQKVADVAARALASGALLPIDTTVQSVACTRTGTDFSVRVLKNVTRKKAAATLLDPTASAGVEDKAKPKRNPFLPYEEAMYVRDAGSRHVILLNKFPVIDEHVLVVTRQFEEQDSLLTASDFAATASVLSQLSTSNGSASAGGGSSSALAFYNAGRIAGASQRHKHLQVIGSSGLGTPFDSLLQAATNTPGSVPNLPFVHFAVKVEWPETVDGNADSKLGEHLMTLYVQLLDAMAKMLGNGAPIPYNFVLTTKWMLLVPRKEECFKNVSVNSLGFVGCLLVRDNEQLQLVRDAGPMAILEHTAFKLEDCS